MWLIGARSIGEGMASINIWGSIYRPTSQRIIKTIESDGFVTDSKNIASDWKKVGDDIRKATKDFEKREARRARVIEVIEVLYTPEEISIFFKSPQPIFDNRLPEDMLDSEKETEKLIQGCSALTSGAYL